MNFFSKQKQQTKMLIKTRLTMMMISGKHFGIVLFDFQDWFFFVFFKIKTEAFYRRYANESFDFLWPLLSLVSINNF